MMPQGLRVLRVGLTYILAWLCLWGAVLFFMGTAQAAPVSLDLRGVTVPEIADVVFKQILKRDYLLGAGINGTDPKVTLSVAAVEPANVLPLMAQTLGEFGIALDASGPVVRVYRPAPGGGAAPLAGESCPTCAAIAAGNVQAAPAMLPAKLEPPAEFASYKPKGKSVEFLGSVAKLAGAVVPELKGRADLVVFGGSAEVVAKARKLLEEVDTVTPGMLVRAALVEFSETQSEARSLQAVLTLLAGRLGGTYQAGALLANGVSVKGGTLQAALTAIEGDNRFRYVAEPTLRVADGEKARLVVGSEVPVRSGVTIDKAGNPVQGVDYRTSGVVIHVEPRRLGDHLSVKVGSQISSFAQTTTSNIDSPTLFKRESETTVLTKPGELVILAGMDESRDASTRSGFSFLPSWAHGASADKTRSQLVLMLEVQPDAL